MLLASWALFAAVLEAGANGSGLLFRLCAHLVFLIAAIAAIVAVQVRSTLRKGLIASRNIPNDQRRRYETASSDVRAELDRRGTESLALESQRKDGYSSAKVDALLASAGKDEFDAIVVGSGLGGLTVAALLSLKGERVLVLEQHDVAGGAPTHLKTAAMSSIQVSITVGRTCATMDPQGRAGGLFWTR